jgi:hypothetical protein
MVRLWGKTALVALEAVESYIIRSYLKEGFSCWRPKVLLRKD